MLALKLILMGAVGSAVWMSLLWFISEKKKNASIAEVGWSGSVFIYCVIYFFGTQGLQGKEFLALVTLIIWAVRLSFHLYTDRLQGGKKEDGRHQKLRERFRLDSPKKTLMAFQVMGLFSAILSVPFLIIALNPTNMVSFFDLMAFTVSYLAIFGETAADFQLKQFRQNSYNAGKVFDQGLWALSRHPNYFFEVLVWVGFFLLGVREPYGILGVVAPAAMAYTLLKFSGVPAVEEEALRTFGDQYRNYQARVSAFIPLPTKKK